MTTDNRTNEAIAEEAIKMSWRNYNSDESGTMPTEAEDAKAAVTALEAAGRLAGEPTGEQVEAAAKIIRRASLETTADPGDFWSDCYESERERWRNAARAALVAAQGAAPQAECSERPGGRPCESGKPEHKTHWSNRPKTTDACHCTPYSEDRGGGYFELMLDPEPDCPEHGEMIAAQVQPSSGVDEDALVQRVYDELMTDDAVAEVWSNGKVMATARRIVKFAVQGGESRGE
ncbi:hypothetical protein ACSHWG_01000 [Leucobacter sp. Z1108]|uniref:hypothetical protein n=1 Tax=Leucobacter sp. Z1108 TaxID=3439066 RepID=UPI003F32BC35